MRQDVTSTGCQQAAAVPRSLPLPIAWLSLARVPACRDQLSKLAAHVEIASKLNTAIDAGALTELGKLEQVGGGWGQAARCL